MEATESTNAQVQIAQRVDQLIGDHIFNTDQRVIVLSAIFNQELSRDISMDLNDAQSKWIESLSFKYLSLVRGNKKTALFKLVTSSSNNLKRYLVSADDLTPKGMFDFSPIEQY